MPKGHIPRLTLALRIALAGCRARSVVTASLFSASSTSSTKASSTSASSSPSSPTLPKSLPRRAKSAPAKSSLSRFSPMNCATPATRPMAHRSLPSSAPYSESAASITVHPGPQSYHAQDGATIHISQGVVESITDDHGQPLSSYELEPLLITGLSDDANRTKRRLVHLRRDSAQPRPGRPRH